MDQSGQAKENEREKEREEAAERRRKRVEQWLEMCGFKKVYMDSSSIIRIYGNWVAPDDRRARLKYHANHTHHETFDVTRSSVKDMKEFGVGHTLYFYFLRFMALTFLVLAILPALPLITLYLGGSYFAVASGLQKMTVGNYGLLSSNLDSYAVGAYALNETGAAAELLILQAFTNSFNATPVTMTTLGVNKHNALVAASYLDLIGIVFYFVGCMYLIWVTRVTTRRVDALLTTLADYSVHVQNGLPPDATEEEVTELFAPWGEVVMVYLARRCFKLMDLVIERRQVLDELEVATAVLQRSAAMAPQVDQELEFEVLNARYDLSLLTEAIKARRLVQGGLPVVGAFVTYLNDSGVTACLAARARIPPPELRLRGQHNLVVQSGPEATDVLFEHLEFRSIDRFCWRMLAWGIKILLVLLGFVLVSIAPSIKRNLSTLANSGSPPSNTDCNANCDWKDANGALALNSTMRTIYKDCWDTGVLPNQLSCLGATICYQCFCLASFAEGSYSVSSYCSEFRAVGLLGIGAGALTVISIITVNFIVQKIIVRVTRLEKHRHRTTEGNSAMKALFVTQFINTGFSIIIANAYLPSVQAAMTGAWKKIFFGGKFPDATPNWYIEVGQSIMIAQLAGIPVRLGTILIDLISRKWARSRSRQALTQAQLDAAYQGHDFELSVRYGEQLAVVFVGLLFASGLPFMYWTCALSFAAHYWLEKYELLRVCRWPNAYSSTLAESAAHTLPFAALWHLLAALWMLSMIGAPRSAFVGTGTSWTLISSVCNSTKAVWANTNQLTPEQMAARFSQDTVAHLLFALVFLTLFLILFHSLRTWIKWYHELTLMFTHQKAVVRPTVATRRQSWAPADSEGAVLGSPRQRRQPQTEEEAEMEDWTATMQVPKTQAPLSPRSGPPVAEEEEPVEAIEKDRGCFAAWWGLEQAKPALPDFALAVRSQLLVGPSTYDMRVNPNYVHAFERLLDVTMDEGDLERVEELEAARRGLHSLQSDRRRLRRERARRMLRDYGAALEGAGEANTQYQRVLKSRGGGQGEGDDDRSASAIAAADAVLAKVGVKPNQEAPWPRANDRENEWSPSTPVEPFQQREREDSAFNVDTGPAPHPADKDLPASVAPQGRRARAGTLGAKSSATLEPSDDGRAAAQAALTAQYAGQTLKAHAGHGGARAHGTRR